GDPDPAVPPDPAAAHARSTARGLPRHSRRSALHAAAGRVAAAAPAPEHPAPPATPARPRRSARPRPHATALAPTRSGTLPCGSRRGGVGERAARALEAVGWRGWGGDDGPRRLRHAPGGPRPRARRAARARAALQGAALRPRGDPGPPG